MTRTPTTRQPTKQAARDQPAPESPLVENISFQRLWIWTPSKSGLCSRRTSRAPLHDKPRAVRGNKDRHVCLPVTVVAWPRTNTGITQIEPSDRSERVKPTAGRRPFGGTGLDCGRQIVA